ncbi:hypothetical protein GCM10009764_02930 [Nocardia ninae]
MVRGPAGVFVLMPCVRFAVMEVAVKTISPAVGSLLAVVIACATAAAPAHAQEDPDPPWSGHCTGEKVKVAAEKPFAIQACQRAYSAAARTAIAARFIDTDAAIDGGATAAAADARGADAARAGAIDGSDAHGTAARYAATAAARAVVVAGYIHLQAASAMSEGGDAAADFAAAAADFEDSADAALSAAKAAAHSPGDAALANKAAEAEEAAVDKSRSAFGEPEPVKIPRITEEAG